MALSTTSRYASKKTIETARGKGIYVPRGKKTVQQFVELACRLGEDTLVIVMEKDAVPSSLAFIKICEDGTWKWLQRVDISECKRQV